MVKKKNKIGSKNLKQPAFFWLKKLVKILSLVGVVLFISLGLFFFIFWLVWQNRFMPSVKLGHFDLTGKTKPQALDLLNKFYQNFNQQELTFIYENQRWVYQPINWQTKINLNESLNQAFLAGRDLSFFPQTINYLLGRKSWTEIPLKIDFDQELFASFSAKLQAEIEKPIILPSLLVKEQEVVLISGSPGVKINQTQLQMEIIKRITYQDKTAINIPAVSLNPPVTSQEEQITYQRAKLLLPKKLVLKIDNQVYEVKQQELVNLLSFTGGFDLVKIASLSANLAKAFNKEPQNAAFNFENGRVTVFRPAITGQQLPEEKVTAKILAGLNTLELNATEQETITLPVIEVKPQITTAEVNDLGIKELLGSGLSYFKGSIASRIHNINLASSRLHGLLIKPGEIFSFNQALGEVSSATGYQPAYIIQQGRTVLGDGGGVCQVSTTLFRAALNAGLPIIERHAHAYRVTYYEQGFGPGLDATVFAPSVDLKFENNTPAHILIQTNLDRKNYSLTIELYGTSDGRLASVSAPRVWDQVPPPPPRYEDDPTLPIGQEKQIDFAAWGAKTAFDYKVVRGEEVLINKTFYSNFKPWQAVYLRGTKQ